MFFLVPMNLKCFIGFHAYLRISDISFSQKHSKQFRIMEATKQNARKSCVGRLPGSHFMSCHIASMKMVWKKVGDNFKWCPFNSPVSKLKSKTKDQKPSVPLKMKRASGVVAPLQEIRRYQGCFSFPISPKISFF